MRMKFGETFGATPEASLVLDAFLPFRLAVAAEVVSRLMARACEDRFGLSIPASRLLCVLAEAGPRGDMDLALGAALDLELATTALTELGARGLIARDAAGLSCLTESGLAVQADLGGLALAAEAALVAGLAPDDVRTAHRLIGRLEAAAQKLLGRAA